MFQKDSHHFKHGIYKVPCNKQYGIATYGWINGNPVHLMTTADGTGVTHAPCQVAHEKLHLKMTLTDMVIVKGDVHFHKQNPHRKLIKNH
eukprot:7625051-Ditylum_brightwellii.AAC.1